MPFGLFAPQPVATVAAAVIVVTQLWLVLSGNFAWLNWLTIVLACRAVGDDAGRGSAAAAAPAGAARPPIWFAALVIAYTALVVVAELPPGAQPALPPPGMNSTFDPLHLVNTYGAFGSVTRVRHEVVIEGTLDDGHRRTTPSGGSTSSRASPATSRRMPRQFAPYHLRLDWLMWFAALSPSYAQPWIGGCARRC